MSDHWAGSLYYNPEDLGLKTVGTIDFSDGCYQFDYLCVWQSIETKKLYWAEDSGCSCPTPFEYEDPEKLDEITNLGEFITHVDERAGRETDEYESSRIKADAAELIIKVKELLK